jgi:membrane associated rhomboid family serine protease
MAKFIRLPLAFTGIMWAVFLMDNYLSLDLARFGIYPRTTSGLIGIITAPFLHGSWQHLTSNTLTLAILMAVLVLFYDRQSGWVIFWSVLLGGFLIWVFGRPVYHIGASALIYSLASFLISIGLFRITFKTLLIAVLVLVFYGGLVYGIFPTTEKISWEGHLLSAIAGVVIAYQMRFKVQKKR